MLYHYPTLLSPINFMLWGSITRILHYAGTNLGLFNLMSIQWNWSHRHVYSILIGPKSSLFHRVRPNPRSNWLKSEIEHEYSRDLEIEDSTTLHPYSLIERYRNIPTSKPWERIRNLRWRDMMKLIPWLRSPWRVDELWCRTSPDSTTIGPPIWSLKLLINGDLRF